MKRADIVIGFEYAYARGDYEYDHGQAQRVRVTSLDGALRRGWGSNAKQVKAIEVEHLHPDGTVRTVGTVQSRQIREAWAPYAKAVLETRLQRIAADKGRLKGLDERAATLLDIIPALRHAGVEDTRGYTYSDEVAAAIERHCPEIFVLNEDGGRTSYFTGPLASSYDDYIRHNKAFQVKADVLLGAVR